MGILGQAGAGTNLFSGIDASHFSGVLSGIMELLPIALPVVVSFIAFRKGWAWLKSQIKGA